MKHLFFWIIFLTAAGGIKWNSRRLINYLKVGKPENRFDFIGQRIKNVLRERHRELFAGGSSPREVPVPPNH